MNASGTSHASQPYLYTAKHARKISPQGQLTLPRGLRERLHVQPGSHISVAVIDGGKLQTSNQPPIANYVGTLAGTWTSDAEDAAADARTLRNEMQPRQ